MAAALLLFVLPVQSQTADEIIGKYFEAIGGREKIGKIVSLYTEGTVQVNGMEMKVSSTTLNGKGMKQEMEIMGSKVISCYTDEGGWMVNPMTGSNAAVDMPEEQYQAGRDQIVIGSPLLDYAGKGYKAEMAGQEGEPALFRKVRLTSPGGVVSEYWFNAETHLVDKIVQQGDMGDRQVNSTVTLSDYRETGGLYLQPYRMKVILDGGQGTVETAITKSEINLPVDPSIFRKP